MGSFVPALLFYVTQDEEEKLLKEKQDENSNRPTTRSNGNGMTTRSKPTANSTAVKEDKQTEEKVWSNSRLCEELESIDKSNAKDCSEPRMTDDVCVIQIVCGIFFKFYNNRLK